MDVSQPTLRKPYPFSVYTAVSSGSGLQSGPFSRFVSPGAVSGEPFGIAQPQTGTMGTKTRRATPIADRFLDPQYNVAAGQAFQSFLAGFLTTYVGRSLHSLRRASTRDGVKPFESVTMDKSKVGQHELVVYQNYNEALSSIYRLIHLDRSQGKALLLYTAVSTLGYLAGSLAQGGKESWVRQQETRIRAQLINRMQGVFRQSIQSKVQFNTQYKQAVTERIRQTLLQAGVAEPDRFISEKPVLESLQQQQKQFYEPTHRTLSFGHGYPDGPPTEHHHNSARVQKGVIFTVGAFTGFVVQGFTRLLNSRSKQPDAKQALQTTTQQPLQKAAIRIEEGFLLKDRESWAMMGMRNPRNFMVMAGFFAMSAAASLGKTFLDGLREIEVTRINARTELDYQTHNWLTQDPLFHAIAEQETVDNELTQLQTDLTRSDAFGNLRDNPLLLQKRIQSILSNIGRNSAPPYFPMTPSVNLVDARS